MGANFGSGALLGADSYVAVGRESTYGTYGTCTALLECLSFGLGGMVEGKKLEQIAFNRVYSDHLSLSKKVEGAVEFYYKPRQEACNYILLNAFGCSTATTATVTAGASYTHTIDIGDMSGTYKSLCVNSRRGDATNGKIYQYTGLRVNELTLSAEIDDALKCSAGFIGKDEATGTTVASALTVTSTDILSFVNGRISVSTFGSDLTSTTYYEVENIEFSLNNNLKGDDGRRIGSNVIGVLPVGVAELSLKCTLRYDTSTAYDAMVAGTALNAEFIFTGATLASSNQLESLKIVMPKIYVAEAKNPEVGGPDEIIKQEISFNIMRDKSSSGGYAVQAILTNATSSYN